MSEFSRPPQSREQLQAWIESTLDIRIVDRALIDGHASPLDYLCHTFLGPSDALAPRDCVLWANRGGGKTFYGAVATALDLIFKPGIEIKILGGSLEQSLRMFDHLRAIFDRPALTELLDGTPTLRRLKLTNGSLVDILAQSHTSVRGSRPQILRCDEVDLFSPEIWSAAQLVTRSKQCGDVFVHGAIEAISTCHVPFGLMTRLIESCHDDEPEGRPARRRLFRWNVIDVLEVCPPSRECEPCALRGACAGRAKQGSGHITIDDALIQQSRTDEATWQAEMLCEKPVRTDSVYPEFESGRHVREFESPGDISGILWIGGMDFGFRSPTVIIWAFVDCEDVVHVVDDHAQSECILDEHIQTLHESRWPTPQWIGVDPAGRARNEHTGHSSIQKLKDAGHVIRSRNSSVQEGIRAIRRRLKPASGPPKLVIHPRCAELIDSMQRYHFDPGNPASITPVKDGPDHAADALRYMIVNLDMPFTTKRLDTLA